MITRSVAAGFGRRGMPPPASNDTGTALGQDDSNWSRDLDLWPWKSWRLWLMRVVVLHPSTHIPSLKFVGLAVRKIWRTGVWALMGLVTKLDLWAVDLETGVRDTASRSQFSFLHTNPLNCRSMWLRSCNDDISDVVAIYSSQLEYATVLDCLEMYFTSY